MSEIPQPNTQENLKLRAIRSAFMDSTSGSYVEVAQRRDEHDTAYSVLENNQSGKRVEAPSGTIFEIAERAGAREDIELLGGTALVFADIKVGPIVSAEDLLKPLEKKGIINRQQKSADSTLELDPSRLQVELPDLKGATRPEEPLQALTLPDLATRPNRATEEATWIPVSELPDLAAKPGDTRVSETPSDGPSKSSAARRAALIEELRRDLTPESQKYGAESGVLAQKNIADILGKDLKGGGALGDLIRRYGTSPEALGAALEDERMDRAFVLGVRQLFDDVELFGKFGSRVSANEENSVKQPHLHGNRTKMPSLEYVAELVRDMLTGKYDLDLVASDGEYPDGSGQHRKAAMDTIKYFAAKQSHETERLHGVQTESLKNFMKSIEGVVEDLPGLRTISERLLNQARQNFINADGFIRDAQTVVSRIETILTNAENMGRIDLDEDEAEAEQRRQIQKAAKGWNDALDKHTIYDDQGSLITPRNSVELSRYNADSLFYARVKNVWRRALSEILGSDKDVTSMSLRNIEGLLEQYLTDMRIKIKKAEEA